MKVILFTDIADTAGYGKYAGTYKLATEIRKHGYTCQVIDNFSWLGLDRLKILMDKFVTNDTILIGFSCTLNEKRINGKVQHWGIPDHEFTSLIQHLRQINSKVVTCVGGSRITAYSDWPEIDYVVVNKADIAILKLLDHITNNNDLKFKKNKHSKVINKTKFAAATWIGRILSLGYTIEEIFSIIRDPNINDTSIEVYKRTNVLKKMYYDKLIEI